VRRESIQSIVLGASWPGYTGEGLKIERYGKQLSLGTLEGQDAYYANLEDHVRLLQGLGAKVYLILSPPVENTFLNPSMMITRHLITLPVSPNAGKSASMAYL
jgi:hypothetical protein